MLLQNDRKQFAFPLTAYIRRSLEEDAETIRRVCTARKLCGVVVGVPIKSMKEPLKLSKSFTDYLEVLLKQEALMSLEINSVCLWDEAYSSMTAREHLPTYLNKKEKRKRFGAKHTVDQVSYNFPIFVPPSTTTEKRCTAHAKYWLIPNDA